MVMKETGCFCETWLCHSGDAEGLTVFRCYVVLTGKSHQRFEGS